MEAVALILPGDRLWRRLREREEPEVLATGDIAARSREFSTVFLKEHLFYRIVRTFAIVCVRLTRRVGWRVWEK
jgi:hypothetical protein